MLGLGLEATCPTVIAAAVAYRILAWAAIHSHHRLTVAAILQRVADLRLVTGLAVTERRQPQEPGPMAELVVATRLATMLTMLGSAEGDRSFEGHD